MFIFGVEGRKRGSKCIILEKNNYEEYFSNKYNLIAINLSKQIELEDADTMRKINFIGRLKRNERVTIFFIIEKK